jgi:hypothetical protein
MPIQSKKAGEYWVSNRFQSREKLAASAYRCEGGKIYKLNAWGVFIE